MSYVIEFVCVCRTQLLLRRQKYFERLPFETVSDAFEALPEHAQAGRNERCEKSGMLPPFEPHPQEDTQFRAVSMDRDKAARWLEKMIQPFSLPKEHTRLADA